MTDDQRHDMPSRHRVEQIGETVNWIAKATSLVLAGVVGGMFILAVFTYKATTSNEDQNERIADVVAQIQAERVRNTLDACRVQNVRHDATVARLIKLTTGGDSRARQATISLIDALAPKRNCEKVVQAQVKGARP